VLTEWLKVARMWDKLVHEYAEGLPALHSARLTTDFYRGD